MTINPAQVVPWVISPEAVQVRVSCNCFTRPYRRLYDSWTFSSQRGVLSSSAYRIDQVLAVLLSRSVYCLLDVDFVLSQRDPSTR